jgi:predicted P-loop ATPase
MSSNKLFEKKGFSGLQMPETATQGKVTAIVDFLQKNYNIAVDSIDPQRIYISPIIKKYDHPVKLNDISLHMMEDNIPHSDNMLRKILYSPNYTKTINPIKQYFENLKGKYEGKSQIDLLCSFIKARDFGDQKQKNFYQDRMVRLVRKWCVASVACATGIHPNDFALGFLHPEELIGKSYLAEFFLPKSLQGFFQLINNDSSKYSLEDLFARRLFVLFDELVGINKRDPEEFKKVMTAKTCSIKLYGDPYPQVVQRTASALLTSNRTQEMGGFLTARMGDRRFALIELDTIDHEYSLKVDVDQIWAEAVMLLDQNFAYKLIMKEVTEFKDYNRRYYIETPAAKYIRMFYSIPEKDKEGEWLTATEILTDLMKRKKIRQEDFSFVTKETIGVALRSQGFERKGIWVGAKNNSQYKYSVCIL